MSESIVFQAILLKLTEIASEYSNAAGTLLTDVSTDAELDQFCLMQGKAYGVQAAMDAIKEMETRYQGVSA